MMHNLFRCYLKVTLLKFITLPSTENIPCDVTWRAILDRKSILKIARFMTSLRTQKFRTRQLEKNVKALTQKHSELIIAVFRSNFKK